MVLGTFGAIAYGGVAVHSDNGPREVSFDPKVEFDSCKMTGCDVIMAAN